MFSLFLDDFGLTVSEFLERKARSSAATSYTYGKALVKLALCCEVESADVVAEQVKAHKLDAYKTLDKFVSYLVGQGLAPKTVIVYVNAATGFLRYEDVEIDAYKFKTKVAYKFTAGTSPTWTFTY